jgi:Phytanoyl-CoA dioxygenase (PhyH)
MEVMKGTTTLKQKLIHHYFSIRNAYPVWYKVMNRVPRALYQKNKPELDTVQKRISNDLRREGIAFTTLKELFGNENPHDALKAYMDKRGKIEGSQVRRKTFLVPFWDEHEETGVSNPFFMLAMHPRVLSIVNTYDRMWRILNYIHLTETVPVGDAAPAASQRWHRDPEEVRTVKMFLYMSDVDENAGPFTVVRQSQFGPTKYGAVFPQKLPSGCYPDADDFAQKIDSKDIVPALGAAGTVIFCDTAALHRGGHAKTKSRFMFTAFYPSNVWSGPGGRRLYTLDTETKNTTFSEEQVFAIRG